MTDVERSGGGGFSGRPWNDCSWVCVLSIVFRYFGGRYISGACVLILEVPITRPAQSGCYASSLSSPLGACVGHR